MICVKIKNGASRKAIRQLKSAKNVGFLNIGLRFST